MSDVKGFDLVIDFDTTGSMYPCLTQVRRVVVEFVQRLVHDVPGLRIAIIAHGDYCDGARAITAFDFSTNVDKICDFIRTVPPTDGGDLPECYEKVLSCARTLSWQAGNEKALVVLGDDVPHDKGYRYRDITVDVDWKNELALLVKDFGIRVYGVHAMPGIRRHSKWFYERLASASNGYYLTLDQFNAVNDIILAICYKMSSPTKLNDFRTEIIDTNRMNRNMAQVFTTLTGEEFKVKPTKEGLVPIPTGRFQVLYVDLDTPIQEFVKTNGLGFKKGRGFYQFINREIIQEKKEVVLVDQMTGDMFTGDEARNMIGVPYGTRKRLMPKDVPGYDIFIQSTSHNRKLDGKTKFLYEVEDWDRTM